MPWLSSSVWTRFKDSPEKMALYTGLPDGKAFGVLWEYLDASEDTLVTARQLPDDQRKRSRRHNELLAYASMLNVQ